MPRVRTTREIEGGRQCERTRARRRTAGHGRRGRARAAGPAGRTGRAVRGIHARAGIQPRCSSPPRSRASRSLARPGDPARAARHRRARPTRAASAAPTRARSCRSCASAPASSPTSRRSARWWAARRCCRSSWASIAIVCAIKRKWRIAAFAVFVLVVESATYRVASIVVPRDRPHVAAPGGPAGRRELPVRPHRRLARRLLRPRAAAHVGVPEAQLAPRRLGDRRSCFRSSSPCRACTAACTTRSTSPRAR